ncbi:unnamed protein product, partial [Brenthis ino]
MRVVKTKQCLDNGIIIYGFKFTNDILVFVNLEQALVLSAKPQGRCKGPCRGPFEPPDASSANAQSCAPKQIAAVCISPVSLYFTLAASLTITDLILQTL